MQMILEKKADQSSLDKKSETAITDLSKRDPVSGCYNNKSFMRLFNQIFSFRNDTQGPLHADEQGMLILVDIQDFDLIENVYGRSVALNCLREMGATLVSFLEDNDMAGRLRGGEFAIVMRKAGLDSCLERLHKLMAKLKDLHIRAGHNKIELTADLGLKPYNPGDSAIAIMAGADMYKQTMIEEDRYHADKVDDNPSDIKENRGNHSQRLHMS